ncbi:unnamed protein product [Paramecium sonneborni]|uniref:Alpha-type protein kinase domain-containing protein n=1 Tax=Paramecium sonneborni TaxID=65129 RepID=A0A8S1KVC3_9CILI|nr:unnamed protein product [Paramecium sonneborni]
MQELNQNYQIQTQQQYGYDQNSQFDQQKTKNSYGYDNQMNQQQGIMNQQYGIMNPMNQQQDFMNQQQGIMNPMNQQQDFMNQQQGSMNPMNQQQDFMNQQQGIMNPMNQQQDFMNQQQGIMNQQQDFMNQQQGLMNPMNQQCGIMNPMSFNQQPQQTYQNNEALNPGNQQSPQYFPSGSKGTQEMQFGTTGVQMGINGIQPGMQPGWQFNQPGPQTIPVMQQGTQATPGMLPAMPVMAQGWSPSMQHGISTAPFGMSPGAGYSPYGIGGTGIPNNNQTNQQKIQEKKYLSEIAQLKQELEDNEKYYKERTETLRKQFNLQIEGLKRDKEQLESDLQEKHQSYRTQQLQINSQKQTIDKISKEIEKNKAERERQEEEIENLKLTNQNLIRKTIPQNNNNPQVDQTILFEYEKQIQKLKEDIKKIKEEYNQKIKNLEGELDETQVQVQKEKNQSDKEHQYFMEARDEITKQQKKIKEKEEKIRQLEGQIINGMETLKKTNYEKSKIADESKQKDFEIQSLNNEIENLNKIIEQLKKLLNDAQTGKKVNINNDKALKDLENQQNILRDQKRLGEEQIRKENEMRENERQEKLKQDQIRKEQQQKDNKQKKDTLIQQGNLQMQNAKREFGQLDVCFIVDVTGSMESYKEQTKQSVRGSLQIIKQATNRDTNWASVCYQDIPELKASKNQKYYEYAFSKDSNALQTWFDSVKCGGGGDAAEDIRGAIKQVCKLNWPSRFRIAILICDAPCHGKRYNGGCSDNYPNDDIQDAIEELIEKNIILIALNFTKYTVTMYEEIKKIYQSKNKLDLFLYQDLQNNKSQAELAKIMAQYIGEASQNATQTNKNQTKSKQGAIQQEVVREKEGAMEALCKQGNFYDFEKQPNVQTINTKFTVLRVEIKQDAFDRNIEMIEKIQCPQDFTTIQEGNWNCLRTEKPFAFGMMKDVFLMKKLQGNSEELYVIKTPIGSKPYQSLNDALKECKSHLICQKLMKRFTNELQDKAREKEKQIKIPSVIYSDFLILQENQNSFWIAERFFKGEFVKYNNNYGFIHEDPTLELNKFAQSFTYYTYFISSFNYMVSDVQGVGNYFTDPAINTIKGTFDDTDMGQEGTMMYLVNYENRKALLTFEYLDLLDIYG